MMTDLYRILQTAGIDRLHEGRKEISGSCPVHFGGTRLDTHPSWSINRTTLLHFCQSCHYKGTLSGLLHDLTGAAPPDLMDTLKQDDFLRRMEGVRDHAEEHLEPVVPLLTDWVLVNVMRPVPGRLLELRHLQRSAIDVYGIRYDGDTKQWVMPIRNLAGELMGAQYRSAGAVLTLPEGLAKSLTLFGYLQMQHYDTVALVESPLDAVRLYGCGIPAVSSLGAWVSEDQCRLLARTFSVVYLALDDDKAGREGSDYAANQLRKMGCATVPWSYAGLTDEDGKKAKDPGDAADDEMLLASWHRTTRWGL